MNIRKIIIKSFFYLRRQLYVSWSFFTKNIFISSVQPKVPFDIVITWVDWSNKYFIEQMKAAGGKFLECESGDFIELKYLLRSIEKHKIPYRYIHIVHSDNHPPPQYLKETAKLFFVPHSKLVSTTKHLPLIHRESIKIHLPRIPNLAENFFYLEDDILILDKRAFFNKLYDFNHKKVKCHYKNLALKYDTIQSQGLWFQATVNAHKLALGEQFNEQNYAPSMIFGHTLYFLNTKIIQEIAEKYPRQFLITASYQNQIKEKDKEKDLVCLVALYNNYLVHHLNFKPSQHHPYFHNSVHTNGISDNSTKEIAYFKKRLTKMKRYVCANLQGNGISDEYPECNKIRTIYMNSLNQEYPTPSSFEIINTSGPSTKN